MFSYSKVSLLPNGVNLSLFSPKDKKDSLKRLNWNDEFKNILFPANSDIKTKNYSLAVQVIKNLKMDNVKLHTLKNVNHSDMPTYFSAADAVLFTSLSEGSPNVIKEAMACNRPIVSTDVGDVSEVISNTEGCFTGTLDSKQLSALLLSALKVKHTSGRKKCIITVTK